MHRKFVLVFYNYVTFVYAFDGTENQEVQWIELANYTVLTFIRNYNFMCEIRRHLKAIYLHLLLTSWCGGENRIFNRRYIYSTLEELHISRFR